ncbi:MAG: hypothetical protein GY778_14965, partial [bacterium]|nr:hypothetical protein [bacterium]
MIWSVTFDPLLPWPVLAAFAVVAVIIAILLVLRRLRGAILRILAMAALLFALANPAVLREDREPLSSV